MLVQSEIAPNVSRNTQHTYNIIINIRIVDCDYAGTLLQLSCSVWLLVIDKRRCLNASSEGLATAPALARDWRRDGTANALRTLLFSTTFRCSDAVPGSARCAVGDALEMTAGGASEISAFFNPFVHKDQDLFHEKIRKSETI
jgi:hypothetical protein